MRMIRNSVWLLLAAILAAPGATLLRGQNVPPPPKPVPDGPSLEEILDSLKRVLASSGELNYKNGSTPFYSRVGDVRVEPADCRIRVTFIEKARLQTEEHADWFFLESIDAADVLTLQEVWSRFYAQGVELSPGYEAAINGNPGRLKFAERAVATKVAQLLLAGARICQARPLSFNAAAGNPSLKETLQFIVQKLNDEAAAQWVGQWGAGSSPGSYRVSDASPDPVTCQLRYLEMGGYRYAGVSQRKVLSFRRVQKIEVLPLQDVVQQAIDEDWQTIFSSRPVVSVTPNVLVLRVMYPGGQVGGEIYFSDGEIADRVAKAMNHAAELCRPVNKELF
jgi:hypothetical protein